MFFVKCAMFLCLSSYIIGANARKVSYIEPCKWNDKQCIMESALKAFPHLINGDASIGTISLKPLILKRKINADNGDLKLDFENLSISRLDECKIIEIDRPKIDEIHLILETPLAISGNYKVDGQLFVLDIYGHGPCDIETEKMRFELTISMKEIKKDDVAFYKFGKFDYKFTPVEKVSFNFSGLMGGDKKKAEPFIDLLDKNWFDLMSTIGGPVCKEVVSYVVQDIGKLLSQVPINELQLE